MPVCLRPTVSQPTCAPCHNPLAPSAPSLPAVCSPFFPAFKNGLVQDASLADAIFAFTDAIPGADIGAASQTVSLLSSSLISEVDMTVFPGFTGTVITSSRLQVGACGADRGTGGAGTLCRLFVLACWHHQQRQGHRGLLERG